MDFLFFVLRRAILVLRSICLLWIKEVMICHNALKK